MKFLKRYGLILLKTLGTGLLIYAGYRALDQVVNYYEEMIAATGRWPISLILFITFIIFVGLLLVFHVWGYGHLSQLSKRRSQFGKIRWLITILSSVVVSWLLLYSTYRPVVSGWWVKSFLLVFVLFFMSWILSNDDMEAYTIKGWLRGIILFCSLFVLADELQTAVSYPFSLGWSEGNRLWDYSILYGRDLYDVPADVYIPVYTSIGRQSLWGLPFLLPSVSIFMVRLWDVILYTIPYFLLGLAIFYRKKQDLGLWVMLGLWVFLFLRGGPIYTPLVLVAILVVLTRKLPLWLGILFVAIAAYYAMEARFTWVFTAGMWAALIAFLEPSQMGKRSTKRRWLRAIVLGLVGLVVGYFVPKSLDDVILSWLTGSTQAISQAVEAVTSGGSGISLTNLGDILGRQPLLWYRLLPNPTFPTGILLGLLVLVSPLCIVLVLLAKKVAWRLTIWQKLLLLGELLAFLIVGLIISVKIGGGADLHNLDMFLISLVIVAGLIWQGGGNAVIENIQVQSKTFQLFLLATALIPGLLGVIKADYLEIPSKSEANAHLGCADAYSSPFPCL